jgi:two-component system chemotaxis sensor kinase CheA
MIIPLTFDVADDELEIFQQEVNEHLRAIEAGVLQLGEGADAETLPAVFRAAHTLKAVAGTVGHQPMVELTHTMETLFGAMREARLAPTPEVTDELLAAVDRLRALRDEVLGRQSSGLDVAPLLARLRERLADASEGRPPAPAGPAARRLAGRPLTPDQAARARSCRQDGLTLYEAGVWADAEAFAPAARLLQAVQTLAEAGPVISQHPTTDDLLADRHEGHLWLVVAAANGPADLEDRLGAVSELTEVQVQPYALDVAPPEFRGDTDKTVRISVERLDTLLDLVGEMVTDRTRLEQIVETQRTRYGKEEAFRALDETIGHLDYVIDQLQDEVMRARMLPIAQLFDRFPRLVHDLARAAGKEVHLVVAGETTELDRSIIEAIGDPLIHLLRNAVDHGLERPEARVAAGKPPAGTIRLTAEHAEGQIVITVQDDGPGIHPGRIRRAAVSRGLLSEEEAAHLTDDEAIALIFRPGLSTSEQVSDVSGRGVGLDVVRANVGRLGGSVLVESEMGQGTVFRVTLPLTLAIVQTMLVALRDDVYAIPLTGVVESLYLSDVTVHGVKGHPAIRWRDQVLPLLDLGQLFAKLKAQGPKPDSQVGKSAIVVVSWGRLQAGLVVNRIIGKQEIVVKPLGALIGTVPGLSGCTILGDGRIALIVDVPGLINAVTQARAQMAQST